MVLNRGTHVLDPHRCPVVWLHNLSAIPIVKYSKVGYIQEDMFRNRYIGMIDFTRGRTISLEARNDAIAINDLRIS